MRFDPNQPRDPEGKWTDTGENPAANIDPKLLKALSSQLSSLSKQYGFDIDGIESGDQLDPNHIMALRFDEESGYTALLVPDNFNTLDKIREKLDRTKSAWANSIEAQTVEDVINHEYGHLLYFKAMGYSERMAIKDAFNISVKYGIGMSDLGMKNEREFFAETFLMYKRGEFIRDRDLQRALKPVYSKLAEYEK